MHSPLTLCILGGCNGAGKSTLARELLPMMELPRFLNAAEIARGLSPLDAAKTAFKAGRLLLEEARALVAAGTSFALESTLSGKTYVALLKAARGQGYRIVIYYIMIGSADQAVERVRLRVKLGGHHAPEEDVRRRYERSLRHLFHDYLPLADEWAVWDNLKPPALQVASLETHGLSELSEFLTSKKLMEPPYSPPSEMSDMVLEASRRATVKMLEYYRRMGVKVTPQMTLAPDQKEPSEFEMSVRQVRP
jgi:predicted ABC-type ATPase